MSTFNRRLKAEREKKQISYRTNEVIFRQVLDKQTKETKRERKRNIFRRMDNRFTFEVIVSSSDQYRQIEFCTHTYFAHTSTSSIHFLISFPLLYQISTTTTTRKKKNHQSSFELFNQLIGNLFAGDRHTHKKESNSSAHVFIEQLPIHCTIEYRLERR